MRKHRKILYPILYVLLVIVISFNIVMQSTKEFIEERKKYMEENDGKEGMRPSLELSKYSNFGNERDNMPTKYVNNRKDFIKKWNFTKAELLNTTLDTDEYKKHCVDWKKGTVLTNEKNDHGIANDISTKIPNGAIPTDQKLVNYHILSSYNSCCGGYKDMDYVDVEILRMVLKRGARFVDFEVYSVEGMPVVGSSAYNYNGIPYFCKMDSLNHVLLEDCFKIIALDKLGSNSDGNLDGPFFINLRIHSKKKKLFKTIGGLLTKYFNEYLSNKKKEEVVETKDNIDDFKKIFIIAENPFYDLIHKTQNDPLVKDFYAKINLLHRPGHTTEQRINIISSTEVGDPNCDQLTSGDTVNCQIFKLSEFNVIAPNKQVELKNYSHTNSKEKGAQFIAMNWANPDENMSAYYNWFVGSATPYILKASHLQLDVAVIKTSSDSKFMVTQIDVKKLGDSVG